MQLFFNFLKQIRRYFIKFKHKTHLLKTLYFFLVYIKILNLFQFLAQFQIIYYYYYSQIYDYLQYSIIIFIIIWDDDFQIKFNLWINL